ncbi:hypothetical protein [Duganella sp. CF517]|nr:hypothetical protein [Duganella sp. CF517]
MDTSRWIPLSTGNLTGNRRLATAARVAGSVVSANDTRNRDI